jgi:hypothetical protein
MRDQRKRAVGSQKREGAGTGREGSLETAGFRVSLKIRLWINEVEAHWGSP